MCDQKVFQDAWSGLEIAGPGYQDEFKPLEEWLL
jgi:hypothetical protein